MALGTENISLNECCEKNLSTNNHQICFEKGDKFVFIEYD